MNINKLKCKNCMKQIIQIVLLSIFLISCSTSKHHSTNRSSTIDPNYLNVPQDSSKIAYEGGDGSSMKNAIVIKNAKNSRDGVAAEYAYIEKMHGEDWERRMQALNAQKGRIYDVITIRIKSDNTTKTYYFDITEFFGK